MIDWRHMAGMTLAGALVAGVAGLFVEMGTVGFWAGAFGGAVAGLATGRFFGRNGWQGWANAMIVGLLATIAGAFAGAVPVWYLDRPAYMLGVIDVAGAALVSVFLNPLTVILWVAAMAALHLCARRRAAHA